MPSMKPHTMIWSCRESRWKHIVTTSFSAAPLHIGSDCDRQNARLHWLHDGEACARRAGLRGMMGSTAWSSSRPSRTERGSADGSAGDVSSASSEPSGSFRWEPGMLPVDLDLISIMVLLEKHVHLQNVGAAIVAY